MIKKAQNYITPKTKNSQMSKCDIIKAILDANVQGVGEALEEDSFAVQSIHEPSNMNATMLAANGCLPDILSMLLNYASYIDFRHKDMLGRNLLDVASDSLDDQVYSLVGKAYKIFAPHLINNWPEP